MKETDLQKLVIIMNELREECPWDKKQTIHTLRQQSIEELYELTDAIDAEDWAGMKEELGDLLLHIVFYAKIASEKHQFTIQDVIDGISEKLVKRHPHIYGDLKLSDADEVKRNWEKLKLAEGKKSILSGIPTSLPSLVKAMRLQEKAAQTGFEWENATDVWKKVEEEKAELLEAMDQQDTASSEKEAGDLLFSIINYIRFSGIDADHALELTNKKFIHRFKKMEEMAEAGQRKLHDLSLEEMDALWNAIKKNP